MGRSAREVVKMPGYDGAFASFVRTHEARLVRSLVSEARLSPAAAAAVAEVVLPAAHARGFATDGAAYGWLRIAARHVAADSADWAGAADAALVRADLAAAALAELPAADRELLRLRYVDGLLPDALASRLGASADDVLARLDRARAAALSSLPAQRRAVSFPRAAAAFAAAAAAVALSMGGAPTVAPPAVEAGAAPVIDLVRPVTGREPIPTFADVDFVDSGRTVALAATHVVPVPPPADGRPPRKGPGEDESLDTLYIAVPAGTEEVFGGKEVPFEQRVGRDRVALCDAVPAPPKGVARCVRGHS